MVLGRWGSAHVIYMAAVYVEWCNWGQYYSVSGSRLSPNTERAQGLFGERSSQSLRASARQTFQALIRELEQELFFLEKRRRNPPYRRGFRVENDGKLCNFDDAEYAARDYVLAVHYANAAKRDMRD